MLRSFQRDADKPRPEQPSVVGEFYCTPDGYICALCNSPAKLIQNAELCGIRCINPDCPQRDYTYEPLRVWLPRAQAKRALARE